MLKNIIFLMFFTYTSFALNIEHDKSTVYEALKNLWKYCFKSCDAKKYKVDDIESQDEPETQSDCCCPWIEKCSYNGF